MFKGRAYAYQMVFDKQNKFLETVLKDLAKFCRAHESTFELDPRKHAVLEGRREVWLRIQEHLNLSPDEFAKLHRVKEINQEKKP